MQPNLRSFRVLIPALLTFIIAAPLAHSEEWIQSRRDQGNQGYQGNQGSSPVQGPEGLPICEDRAHPNNALPPMNEEVLRWKVETPNQTLKRARIRGTLVRIVQLRKSHEHFEVSLGQGAQDTIELIYNREFGRIPDQLSAGAVVDACGDYITSREQAGRYPPSPMGAILHWIHFNPGDRDGGRHEHGYIAIDGVVYGQVELRTP